MSFPDFPTQVGDYMILDHVGEGGFCKIYKAMHVITMQFIAIKVFPKKLLQKHDENVNLRNEMNILKDINHPYIVKVFDLIEDSDNLYMVMEHIDNGNLFDYVTNLKHLDEETAKKFFAQIVCALDYLHNVVHIAHRDLKLENILLDKDFNIKLIDFGFSKRFSNENPIFNTTCGSPFYASPELITNTDYTAKTDIWALGICLYSMILGELPFFTENLTVLFKMIIHSSPILPTYISSELHDLLNKLLTKDPQYRITISEIKLHKWISGASHLRYINKIQEILPNINNLVHDEPIFEKMESLDINTEGMYSDITNDASSKRLVIFNIFKRQATMVYVGRILKSKAFTLPKLSVHEYSKKDNENKNNNQTSNTTRIKVKENKMIISVINRANTKLITGKASARANTRRYRF